ncbi:hypothetical protein HUG17_9146 [Dermatophagoides farinae]|uniref:Uncharacterized protein n=1 Tax=Dermatophagoides farinae TaxID=6954 RepID=A0A9D4NTK8_DERFA|nr:hypothetical protein HUG17_9146 [Dermatophagoides farinae]
MSIIQNIIKRNLCLSLLRQNDNGLITRIFTEDLMMVRLITFRMNFSLIDYRYHRITLKYKTFKPAMVMTPISWIMITIFLSLIFWPNNRLLITAKHHEEMFKTPAMDLLFIQMVIMYTFLEMLWSFFMNEVLMYRSPWIDLLAIDIPIQEKKLDNKMRQNLINFIVIINFMTTILFLIMMVIMFSIGILMNYWYLPFYLDSRLTLIQYITGFPSTFLFAIDVIYTFAQFVTSAKLFLFYLLFFSCRIKQLYRISRSLINRSFYSYNLAKKIFWQQFFREYIILYSQMVRLNRSVKVILMFMEITTKSFVMICCVYFSKQSTVTVVNSIFILMAIITYIFTNFSYSRIARIPEYNKKCVQYLFQWLARSQFQNKRLDASIKRMVELRAIIKSNLFVQTMTNNQLGFTCGHLFYITKYKYNELILMNIPLILMFYKQVSNLD